AELARGGCAREIRRACSTLQRFGHFGGGAKPPAPVAMKGAAAHLVDLGGHVRYEAAYGRDGRRYEASERRCVRVGLEQWAASEPFPEHDAHREDVGPAIEVHCVSLLRGEVADLALDLMRPRDGEPRSGASH